MNELQKIQNALKEPLKPCPFCGCESVVSCDHEGLYFYQCQSCLGKSGESPNENIAYWAWQKRQDMYKSMSEEQSKKVRWLVNYLIEENFPRRHLGALCHIVGLFNDCEESESEIFEFAKRLYMKYAA